MTRKLETDRDAIKLAISEQLALNGNVSWETFKEKYTHLARPTFFRYLAQVREEMEAVAADRGGQELKLMQRRIKRQVRTPEITEKKLKANLPVAPSPAVLVGIGPAASDVFDFMASFNDIVADVKMLRDASVTPNGEGGYKLKNPMLMDKSVGRRIELIDTWVKTQDLVWNLERMQELYRVVIEEVGKADPETQQAILARIRTLHNRAGLTADARLV